MKDFTRHFDESAGSRFVSHRGDKMTFWQASLDTRKFSFEAYGKRRSDALMAMGDLLRKHGEQYQLEENWCSDWMGDIQYREIELDTGYRDRAKVDWK
jgi:hypothetical protein